MKCLIIENNKGFYAIDGCKHTIDEINKEDILKLLDIAIIDESFSMDPYDESVLQNPAHRVIYKNIYQKLEEVSKRRVSFLDEKINRYKDAFDKYKVE